MTVKSLACVSVCKCASVHESKHDVYVTSPFTIVTHSNHIIDLLARCTSTQQIHLEFSKLYRKSTKVKRVKQIKKESKQKKNFFDST